jgi:hypothetical protein
MENIRTALKSSLVIVSFVLAGVAAQAQDTNFTPAPTFTLTATNGLLGAAPGEDVLFSATLTNNDADNTLYVNADGWTSPSPLTVADDPFNGNNGYAGPIFTFSLDPSGGANPSYTGPLFYVDVPVDTPYGLYSGTFTLYGGADSDGGQPDGQLILGTVPYYVNVPEGGDSLGYLLAAAAMCFGGMALRSRNNRRAGESA